MAKEAVSHLRAEGFLTEDEQTREVKKAKRTLKLWRRLGVGPAWTTDAGGHVWYHTAWNREYLEGRKRVPARERGGRS
jgi:hypothetical protein